MEKVWEKIKNSLEKLKKDFPEVEFDYKLNTGASEKDFENLEKITQVKLPEDFKEFYRIHNWEAGYEWILEWEEFLSIERIIDEYSVRKGLYDWGDFKNDDWIDEGCEPEDDWIKSDFWWNPKWISITADGGWNSKMQIVSENL